LRVPRRIAPRASVVRRMAFDASAIRILMFDFYGTVVDMQGGLTDAIAPYLERKGYDGDAGSVVTWWRRTHFENSMIDALLHREHTPYREIGRRAVDYTLERAGIEHTDAEVRELVDAITRLPAFPDVAAALDRLRGTYELVILSNGDPDMLAAGVPYAKVGFDRVISVAEASAFKPHVATYRKAAEIVGAEPAAILFVANHAFDCIGAKAFGMQTAFIDRRKRPFGQTPHQPDVIVRDVAELAEMLLSAPR
jgi:2-haloacid dehalogenase